MQLWLNGLPGVIQRMKGRAINNIPESQLTRSVQQGLECSSSLGTLKCCGLCQ